MNHTASKPLFLIFVSLGIAYFIVILGFNSFYDHLFVHVDNNHRAGRNMFHQFSKENYFHTNSRNVNKVKRKDDELHSVDEELDVYAEEQNMIEITQEDADGPITKPNLRNVDIKKELNVDRKKSKLGSLSCAAYGGPNDEFARKEMVYWRDIPEDEAFVSPYKKYDKERYLTFEPDGGGWNNIRMSMETIVAMAHTMGRTLVMPPSQHMYLLKKHSNRHDNFFSFADFYHLEDLASEHLGIKIISMEEFLKRTAMKGLLVNTTTGLVSFPPNNRTDWNGRKLHEKELWEYLRDVTDVRNWKPDNCIFAFPSSPGKTTEAHEVEELQAILKSKGKKEATKAVPVDAPVKDRLLEMAAGRKNLCVYDSKMQESLVVHFMCYWVKRARLLTHFYTFLFFENYKHDLWTKRFVRDHLRYVDSLQCAAARVIYAIREKAKELDSKNTEGVFDSFHVRRGDFQYKETRVSADELLRSCKDEIPQGSTIFIATDERKKDFFKPLTERYHLFYLDDFKDLIKDVHPGHYGMLDQLIASKGRVFFGTYFSTFTGFIDRMRGYHVGKNKEKGYEEGLMLDSYFFLSGFKDKKREYAAPRTTFSREFPIAWRDIDHDVNNM